MSGLPQWTPGGDGVYLTFADAREIVDLSGNSLRDFPNSHYPLVVDGHFTSFHDGDVFPFSPEERITSYSVSPQMNRIAYSTSGQHLWVADLDGSNIISLGRGIKPHFSPDGEWITFMLTEDDGHDMLNSDIFIIGIDGKDRQQITRTSKVLEMHPRWSPDGSWIVYDTESQGQLFLQQMERR